MSKEINLIYNKRKEIFERAKQIKIVRYIAITALAIVVLSSAILFILNRSSQLPDILKKEQIATQSLSFLQKKAGNLLLLKSRLKDIEIIIKNQNTLDQIIQEISSNLPSDVNIETFAISKKDITLIVSSPSLTSINKVLDFFINNVSKKKLVKEVTVNSLMGDIKTGKYTLSLNGELL